MGAWERVSLCMFTHQSTALRALGSTSGAGCKDAPIRWVKVQVWHHTRGSRTTWLGGAVVPVDLISICWSQYQEVMDPPQAAVVGVQGRLSLHLIYSYKKLSYGKARILDLKKSQKKVNWKSQSQKKSN